MGRQQSKVLEGNLTLFPYRPRWKRYLVAVLLTAAAIATRFMWLSLDPHAPYVTFYPAVVLAGLYGGLGPGLLAMALSGLAVTYWLAPAGVLLKFKLDDPTDMIGLAFFLSGCTLISAICEAMHRARARAATAEIQSRLAEERRRADAALRASEERLRRAIAIGTVGVIFFNTQGGITDANDAFLRMSGYSHEDLANGRVRWDVMTPPEFMADSLQAVEEFKTCGQTTPYEKQYVRKDGSRWWGLFAAMRVGEDEGVEFIIDITERKRAEGALRKANESLAEADRRKDEFLSMLAHELRNPLAPIRNAVFVLKSICNAGCSANEKAVRYRDIIERQVAHMAHLLDDLLDISRVSRGRIQIHKTQLQLANVLAQAVEMVEPLIEARHHQLHFAHPADDLRVEGDRDRLTQAVGNLLSNAAKYTEEGGQIWLVAAPEGDHVVIRVRDTGVGIAPKMLPCVFDLFAQADQTLARTQGGLGIGLSMVKRLVELHGGTVEARSEGLDRGSEFIIRLPLISNEANL